MKRFKHNLSNQRLTSFNMGELIPVSTVEVLPGDSFQHDTQILLRATPLLRPVMHAIDVHTASFYVPNRLTWYAGSDAAPNDLGFEEFITGGADGNDAQTVPTIAVGTTNPVTKGTLLNRLGIPVYGGADIDVNAMPLRAYNEIVNHYFLDQDIDTELNVQTNTTLQKVRWAKDYFTAARPWEQKGTAPTISLGGDANVLGIGKTDATFPNASTSVRETGGINSTFANEQHAQNVSFRIEEDPSNSGYPWIRADLSTATGVSINTLRLALATQRYMENRALYGSDIVDYLNFLGVNSGDGRLRRPEYLGGGKQSISFSEVLNTAATASNDLGEFGGHGIAAMRSNKYRRFFPEHGYVITVMWVRPKNIYVNALPRHFNYVDKEDYWQKELELIGQQSILNKELYINHTSPDGIHGYNDRYHQYTHIPSQVDGDFDDTVANMWHEARDFSADTALNPSFLTCAPANRIFASTAEDTLYAMVYNRIAARRLVSKFRKPRTF